MEEIIYRRATDSDIYKINQFYNSVYHRNRDKLKFDWEFNSSPAGKAIYIIAELGSEIIGTQCVIPYYLITGDNKIILSGKSEDTLVSAHHRGKQIFEKMYALLIEECKKSNINYIWGFTYAEKPFLKLRFQIPFRSKMGVLVLNPFKSLPYYTSLSPKNKTSDLIKITALVFTSWFKFFIKNKTSSGKIKLAEEHISLNHSGFNYLRNKDSFGLNLDEAFLKYRVLNNPYSANYHTFNYEKNGALAASLTCHISDKNVGYIINTYMSGALTKQDLKSFFKTLMESTVVGKCSTLRFWGFDHNLQNKTEIEQLKQLGFTFINRGISFVWLPLNSNADLNPKDFVLSRMSSQGTD